MFIHPIKVMIVVAIVCAASVATPVVAFEWQLAEKNGRDPIGTCLSSHDDRGCIPEAWTAYVSQGEPIIDQRDWRRLPKSFEFIERMFYGIEAYELKIEDIPVNRRMSKDWALPAVSTLKPADVPTARFKRVPLRPGDLALDVYFEYCNPSFECLNALDEAARRRDFQSKPLARLRTRCSPRVEGTACYDPGKRKGTDTRLAERVHEACYQSGNCTVLETRQGSGFPDDFIGGTYILRRMDGPPGWELIDVDAPQLGGSAPDRPSVLNLRRFPGRWPKFDGNWVYSLAGVLLFGNHRLAYGAIADCGAAGHGEATGGYVWTGYFGFDGKHDGHTSCERGKRMRVSIGGWIYPGENGDFRSWGPVTIQIGSDPPCERWAELSFSLDERAGRWRAMVDNPCAGEPAWVYLYIQPKHQFLFVNVD